jgi:hypothetical protein
MKPRSTAAMATIAAVLLGASLGGAQPAAADSQIPSDRMGATASFQSKGEKFRLWDTACDGNAVYILYQRSGAQERRLSLTGGCRQMALFDKDFTEGQTLLYRVCVDIPFDVDQCSVYRFDRT